MPSAAQLADAVRRADYTAADKDGWIEWHADLGPIWEIINVAVSCEAPITFALARQLMERCEHIRRRSAPMAVGRDGRWLPTPSGRG